MKILALTPTLLATVLVAAVSATRTTLRGSHASYISTTTLEELEFQVQVQGQVQKPAASGNSNSNSPRRHLMQGISCRLYLEDVVYKNGSHHEEWICELPQEESSILGLQYVEIDRSSTVITSKVATSGESIMTMSKAIVDTDDKKMYIPTDASVEVHNQYVDDSIPRVPRNLAAKTGTLNTLVIRIIDSNNVAPPSNEQLQNDFFDDASCLKSQYEACSYGKLQIQPFSGKTESGVEIKDGVVDVQIANFDITTSTRASLQQTAMVNANDLLGDLNSEKYGLVVFVMPPGSGDWVAYSFVNGKYSFFNDEAASAVSAQMHGVGQNLGLGISGTAGVDGKDFDDKSGMMGITVNEDDFYRCFNPAKSFQLGWYNDKVENLNPLSTLNAVDQFTLNGVSDYEQNPEALVVLRLEQTATAGLELQQDYYIGYNRQDGINKNTFEDGNMVTIVRKESGKPTEYGKSTKVASLYLGQSYRIKKFNNERDIEIKFAGLSNLGTETASPIRDAVIQVVDLENVPQIAEPTESECENYTFEITTDNYPDDNAFVVVLDDGIGEMVAQSPVLAKAETTYATKVCLPYQQNYKFIIYDKFSDGLCCGQGHGSYRAIDSKGNVLFNSDKQNEEFGVKVEFFRVDENPDQVPQPGSPSEAPSTFKTSPAPSTKSPTQSPTINIAPTPSPTKLIPGVIDCKDAKNKFKIKKKGKGKKKNCKWIKKKKKCDTTFDSKPLWQTCPHSCGRCSDL